MRVLLAPMEGVVDHAMRDMLTGIGGIDRCVTEFVRVTQSKLPPRVFYKFCPELRNGGLTASGVPVYVQLLGSHCHYMAVNAKRAADLGAPGIDINFGCPAKQVNRSDGGSVLLREPERVYKIISAVREAVPVTIPVTAKVRLGYSDSSQFADIVDAVVSAGANEITVHARTREDGYKPPAYWSQLAQFKMSCPIPMIANGEIWTPENYQQCIQESSCDDVMLGRGILSCPDLARQIKMLQNNAADSPLAWIDVVSLLARFHLSSLDIYDPKYVGNRLKQWLGYLRRHYSLANDLFDQVKRLRCPDTISDALNQHRLVLETK